MIVVFMIIAQIHTNCEEKECEEQKSLAFILFGIENTECTIQIRHSARFATVNVVRRHLFIFTFYILLFS